MSLRPSASIEEKRREVYGDPGFLTILGAVCYAYRQALGQIDRKWAAFRDLPPEMMGEAEASLPIGDRGAWWVRRFGKLPQMSARWPIMEDALVELVYENRHSKITEAMVRSRVESRLIDAQRRSPEFEYHRLTPAEKTARAFYGHAPKSRVLQRKPLEPPTVWERMAPAWKDPTGEDAVENASPPNGERRLYGEEWDIWQAYYATRYTLAELVDSIPYRPSAREVGRLKVLASDGSHPGRPVAAIQAFHKKREYTKAQIQEIIDYVIGVHGPDPGTFSLGSELPPSLGDDDPGNLLKVTTPKRKPSDQ